MSVAKLRVLAVDDDPIARSFATAAGGADGGVDVECVASASEAFAALGAGDFDLVFLDLGLDGRGGTSVLSEIIAACNGAFVAVVTGDDRSETIVECMRRGAFDFVAKPASLSRFLAIFGHVRSILELRREVSALRCEGDVERNPAFSGIVTRSPLMREVFRVIERISVSPFAALVVGESGVGKELIARAVHDLSGRAGSFVPVNVAGLDDALFSDTLFGHLKGAYTGAEGKRRGMVREADDGTLFLDEIGDIGSESQVKLLRFLQDGEFYPLGADRAERSSARLVLATNADLQAKVRAGSFRADLYYRLMIHNVAIPPLRERREDIPLLVEKFSRDAARALGRKSPKNTDGFVAALAEWRFPGNVRELSALVHGAVSRMEGSVLPASYAIDYIRSNTERVPETVASSPPRDGCALDSGGGFLTLRELTDRHIREALKRSQGNQSIAARLLGISQSTISRYLSAMQ